MIENIISTNENLVQVFCGVRGYKQDGVAHLHIEDVARGLGFDREKNGAMYVMWDRVEQYLADLSFHTSVERQISMITTFPKTSSIACDCLAIADASQACQNLDDDEKQVVTREFDSLLFRESKAQAMTLISESGLYDLIMQSRKPEAKAFKRWVTHEDDTFLSEYRPE